MIVSGLLNSFTRSSLAKPEAWLLNHLGGEYTHAGERVNEHGALNIPVVFACVRVLSETGAALPLFVYERLTDGGKRKATEHPLYSVLHDAPNPEQTAYEFKELLIAHMSVWGNFYAQQILDGRGNVRQLWPLRPDWMTVERPNPDGPRIYRYNRPRGSQRIFTQDEILHIPGLGFDGLKGFSPISLQRQSLGATLATEKLAAKLFANGVKPSGVLQVPGRIQDKARTNLEQSFNESYASATNAHKAIILEEGVKWIQTMIPPNDAQFLETRKFQRSEIAGWYRVPPHFIGDLERATFSNIENQDLGLAKHTIKPWVTRIEQRCTTQLLGPREQGRFFCEFSMDALMRGDSAARAAFYNTMRNIGAMTSNEIRELENMNRHDDPAADELHLQGAMVPIGAAGQQQQQEVTEQ